MNATIPHYALYGDPAQPGGCHSFNFEWIPERSGPNNWDIKPHLHEAFLQILYLRRGDGEVLLDDARWPLKAPCVVVIPAQTVHGLHFSERVDGPVVTAAQAPLESVAGLLMPELMSVIRKPAVLTLDAGTRHARALMPLFLAIEREARTDASGQLAVGMSLLTALLVQIARLRSVHEAVPPAASSRKAAQIERFRTLVDERFRTRAPVDWYAGELGITAGQLSRLCREALGLSSLDVINARIVREAQRELVYTTKSVKQLAAALGFDDEAYFARFFKKHTGQSPTAFRDEVIRQMRFADDS
ncbi:AraC family transcriptional regulator, transcriptional activator of pobA [Burkholderia multivorans]